MSFTNLGVGKNDSSNKNTLLPNDRPKLNYFEILNIDLVDIIDALDH